MRHFLLDHLTGGFTVLAINCAPPETSLPTVTITPQDVTPQDAAGATSARYLGAAPTAIYLIRPDQHVAARWPMADAAQIAAALQHCCGGQA